METMDVSIAATNNQKAVVVCGIEGPVINPMNTFDNINRFKRFLFSEGIELDELLGDVELVEFPTGFA